ncbi:hypothetical protein AN690_0200700 [Citrobacter freundii]|nr:hypothetical protein AN688_0202510 [Citrobacter freundii]OEH35924.1 hypothetical protein AN690_0200700 [Citrobacter freundii]
MTTNHPAHGPVSLDRLHQISEILSKASAQSDGGNLGYAMADAVKVIDGAIAVFGNAPVSVNDDMAYAFHHALSDSSLGADEVEEIKTGLRAAFANVTSQPAPEVPDEMVNNIDNPYGDEDLIYEEGKIEGWNACRAAMLHGKSDGKPELTVWYGAMPETNGKTNWTAILHRKGQQIWEGITIDRSEYPDRVRYEADRMRHLIGELPDEPDILSYDADAHSGYVKPGNSPTTLDGWIPVSERMPNDKDFVWCWGYVSGWTESDGFEAYYDATRNKWWTIDDETVRKVTHWMPLPAAPQQEVKP